jgi:hypothetical protein
VKEEESRSFLKKRSKKLLRIGPSLAGWTEAMSKGFLLLFFKKEGLA